MIFDSVFVCLCFFVAYSVFDCYADEVKSVTEGDSVTLNTGVTKVQNGDLIQWKLKNTRIAEIIKRDPLQLIFVSNEGIFRDKLHMDNQTGSLTIRNIRPEHTGLYELTNSRSSEGTSVKRFNVTVYGPLPIPTINKNPSNCSSLSERSSVSKCVIHCSVVNVSHVTLSWLKGNSLLSSISASDLSISLSLPLEVEDQDNTYSCVINNTIRHQTTHLDISELCHTCKEQSHRLYYISILVVAVLLVIIGIAGGIWLWHTRGCKQPSQIVETEDIHYASTTFVAHPLHHPKTAGEDNTVYSSVM